MDFYDLPKETKEANLTFVKSEPENKTPPPIDDSGLSHNNSGNSGNSAYAQPPSQSSTLNQIRENFLQTTP